MEITPSLNEELRKMVKFWAWSFSYTSKKYTSPSKSQISGLGFRAPMFYNSVTKTLSSYMTPGPGCSKLGYDNQGLVWNLMSGL